MKNLIQILLGAMVCLAANGFVFAAQQPHVVLILADDWGYGSAGCYGADPKVVKTPSVDRLARQGIRFTDANTPSSICSPTRYGLLMGRYPWRTRLKRGVVNVNDPLLPEPKRPSLGGWFKDRGYRTAAIGKWHLGYGSSRKKTPVDWTHKDSLRPGALEMGFDYHFAVPQNHGDATGVYIENDRIFGLESEKAYPYSRSYYGKPYYGFDAPQRVNKQVMEELTDRAVAWLKQPSDQPLFLYFAPVAVHHPITPSDKMRGESGCGPYGDFIQDLDASIGRICDTLDEMGITENTLIIVTSDNGGEIPAADQGKPENTAQNLGLKINGALRGDKHTIWQGGVRVPFVARWPERLAAGESCDAMINLVDVFATLVELLEGQPPVGCTAPDSVSFAKVFVKPDATHDRGVPMVTTDAKGRFAIRRGPWKYIEGDRENKFRGRALFHLINDPAESRNVLAKEQKIAAELQRQLDQVRSGQNPH